MSTKADSNTFRFIIPIDPIPWKRPGQSRFGRYDLQKAVKNQYRAIFTRSMDNHPPLQGNVRLFIYFFMPTPKSLPKKDRDNWHSKKPDLDNLTKLVMDSMNGVCFRDDSQVCLLIAMKGYSDNPRTEIIMTEGTNDQREFRYSEYTQA